jgi:transposase-like protein
MELSCIIKKMIPYVLVYLREIPMKAFIIDETQIKVGSQYIWLWVAIEPKHRQILQIDLSSERTMLVAERFITSLINKLANVQYQQMAEHGIHRPVSFWT